MRDPSAISPGHASVTMTVRADMLNGFGICQGGLIATLADTAFAYACNSWNDTTVASGFDVELLLAGRVDDRLDRAGGVSCRRRSRIGRLRRDGAQPARRTHRGVPRPLVPASRASWSSP